MPKDKPNKDKEAGKGPRDRAKGKAIAKRRANDAFWNKTSFHRSKKLAKSAANDNISRK